MTKRSLVKVKSKGNIPIESEIMGSLNDLLQEGIFRTSMQCGILFTNQTLLKIFGYSSLKDIQSVPPNILYADQEARAFLMDKIKAEGILINQRVLFRKKDGRNFWGRLSCTVVIHEGSTIIEGCIEDISELVRAEELSLQHQHEAEKHKLELDRFIYSASHDIQSPISSILGLINIMKMEIQDEDYRRLVELLEVSTKRLHRFVGSLTNFAENTKREIKSTRINFNSISELILEKLRNHPNFDRVQITQNINGDVPFYSDFFRIHLIMKNIIKNAFDYSDYGKLNQIISVEIVTYAEKVLIEIFDNGVGIANKHLPKIFDMFYRGTTISTGSGIGLFTAREAATKLGGIITLHSEYKIGTSVKIEIPNAAKGRLISKRNSMKEKHLPTSSSINISHSK